MSKNIICISLTIILTVSSCDVIDNKTPFFRHLVTLETDIHNIHFDKTYLDSNTVFPYVVINICQTNELSNYITIYPITSSGKIHFNMFRGDECNDPQNIIFIDSLNLFAPIDTTVIVFKSGGGVDTIIINPNK